MYPHTMAGLFDAVTNGTLADVEEIIKSQKVDINQQYNNMHIIDYTLYNHDTQFEEKINILINSGVIPKFNKEFNIVFQLQFLKNKELQSTILNLIRKNTEFANIYTQHHLDAVIGIPPQTKEEAYKADFFGLIPIHYALMYKKAHRSWFETFMYYDSYLLWQINDELYEGTTLITFLATSDLTSYELIRHLINLSTECRYEILISGLLNAKHTDYGKSFAFLLVNYGKYEYFAALSHDLSVEQKYALLKSAPLNTENIDYGLTVADLLLDLERYGGFTRLTQDFSAEQRYALLKLGLLNSKHINYGRAVVFLLLAHKRYKDFTKLTQDFSAEQRFELLKSGPLNAKSIIYGFTVAFLLLYYKRYEDFIRLTQDLSAEQRYELLKSTPLNFDNPMYGLSVVDLLLHERQFSILESLISGLNLNKLYELLSVVQTVKPHVRSSSIIKRDLCSIDPNGWLSFVEPIKPQVRPIPIIKKTRFNYLLKDNESLLIKIFEPYEAQDFFENFYEKFDELEEGFDLVSFVMLTKINILLHQLLQKGSEQKVELASLINDNLVSLLNLYEQVSTHPKYGKKASELIGRTICQACFTEYRQLFVDFFEKSQMSNKKYHADYKFIKDREPKNALEGFGHHLRVLGCEDERQSQQLGVEFAEAISNKNKLKQSNELETSKAANVETIQMPPAPNNANEEETATLKRRNTELEEENRVLREKLKRTELEEINFDEGLRVKKLKVNDESSLFSAKNQDTVGTLFKQRIVTSQNSPSRTKIEAKIRSAQRRAAQ